MRKAAVGFILGALVAPVAGIVTRYVLLRKGFGE